MVCRMIAFDEVARCMAAYRGKSLPREGMQVASVALLLRNFDSGLEVFFIERSKREGDPWSGHMAFPGGRKDVQDTSERATAERETFEEVGIRLDGASHLGMLDDLSGRAEVSRNMVVSAHVYHVPEPGEIVIDEREVASAFWFPLAGLLEPEIHVQLSQRYGERTVEFPGIAVGEPGRHVVWGLTYRFLEIFLELIGRPLPSGRWSYPD
jgi:8-oxo-dGTP pyrophosphatase MutT (NUDIX family)